MRWDDEEDDALRDYVLAHTAEDGTIDWGAASVGSRGQKQCRERWLQVLDPTLVKGPLSEHEGAALDLLIQRHGLKWGILAGEMLGATQIKRSELALRNFYYCRERRQCV